MKRLLLVACALLPQESAPGDDPLERAPAEGALDNDVFVEVSAAAAEALVRGDAECRAAREAQARGDTEEHARRLGRAFEAWREALVVGGPGALVWYDPARRDAGRLAEGVAAVVERRLAELDPAQRAQWSERYAALAQRALLLAGTDEEALAEVVRLQPFTPGAGRAGLLLADLALESGRRERARSWLERAALDLELARVAGAARALEARRAVLGPPPAREPEAWERARSFGLAGRLEWPERPRAPALRGRADPERLPRPGAVFVGPHELVVQTTEELLRVTLDDRGRPEWKDRQRLADLLQGPGSFLEHDEPGPWPLLPLWTGEALVVVVGRSRLEPNALVVLRPLEPALAPSLGLSLPADLGLAPPRSGFRLAWAVVDDERFGPGGEARPVAGLEGLETLEFQPGPVLSGDLLLVQAREYVNQVRAWLLAFDPRDGRLVWKRLLASGADRVAAERFSTGAPRMASQPLLDLRDEGQALVFAGTHLGAGALLECRDGEFRWLYKNRRRPPRARGWTGDRPPLASGPVSGAEARAAEILWAPWDSDHLYPLRPAVPAAGLEEDRALSGGLPPIPMVEAEGLVGGNSSEVVVLAREGKERTVSARRAGRDRIDALDLGPDEAFAGRGLASAERVWVASDRGVYLLDRPRELYLLDFQTLPEPAGGLPAGGDLIARGRHVIVLGPGGLWSLLTAP